MQLVMLETLLKRAETLRFLAFEAYFYVASDAVSMLGTSDHFKESAVRSVSETLQLAEYLPRIWRTFLADEANEGSKRLPIVLPVVLGMSLRAIWPRFAASLERPIRLFAVLVLAAVVLAAIASEWARLPGFIAAVGAACLAFNLVSMAAGYGVPRLLRLPRDQSIAISMEIGIHNGTLAIFIALNVLGNPTISIPAAVYSIIMFVTAGVFTWWLNRQR
jgi:hypothetical protein